MDQKHSSKTQLFKLAEKLHTLPDLSFKTGSWKKVYKLAHHFYKKEWRGNEQPSPAFDGKKVEATNYGWRHLVGKTNTSNYLEATKRLNLLPLARKVLETTNFIYETRLEVEKKDQMIKRHAIIGKVENGMLIKVIVKEIDGRLIFVSVYPTAYIKKE